MNYQKTVSWMFDRLSAYQIKGKAAFNAKLDGIKGFVSHLNHPEKNIRTIHVAGTNGKGSSSHMLASILQEAGYKVGLYTSPHLKDFRERIKINGLLIPEEYVVAFVRNHFDCLKTNKLSFFEMTVAMAFDYFSAQKVDIAIFEVGLGGRLDSTNIINPEVSLITNIGLDHTDMLGDTLLKIAIEKAGIIKPNTPVVISEYQEEVAETFKEIAKKNNAPLEFAKLNKQYKTDLLGSYQEKNIQGVVAVIKRLTAFKVSESTIVDGLLNVVKNTGLMGRWQVLNSNPKVVCDTAHNKEGLSLVLAQLKKESYSQLFIVLGMVKGKDLAEILPLFPKKAKYFFCQPNIERALNAVVLKEKAAEFGLDGVVSGSVSEAYKEALEKSQKDDFVYVGGSTFVVAEII